MRKILNKNKFLFFNDNINLLRECWENSVSIMDASMTLIKYIGSALIDNKSVGLCIFRTHASFKTQNFYLPMVPKSRRLPSRLGSRRGQVNPWPPRVPWAGPDSRASGQTESRFSVVQETFDKIPYFIRDRSFSSLIYGYTKFKGNFTAQFFRNKS